MTQDKNSKMPFSEDPLVLEAIGEIAQVGAGQTAKSLHEITKQRIDLEIPEAFILPSDPSLIAKKLQHSREDTVGVFQSFQGYEMEGKFAFLLPKKSAQELLAILSLDWKVRETGFNQEQKTTLQQIGSILSQSFLNSLGEQFDMKLLSGVGILREDILENILEKELIDPFTGKELIVITIVFSSSSSSVTGEPIVGYYCLLLDQRGMVLIQEVITKILGQ